MSINEHDAGEPAPFESDGSGSPKPDVESFPESEVGSQSDIHYRVHAIFGSVAGLDSTKPDFGEALLRRIATHSLGLEDVEYRLGQHGEWMSGSELGQRAWWASPDLTENQVQALADSQPCQTLRTASHSHS